MRLGEFELTVLSGGRFRLDGGAMFGIVPRPLWERARPPDERNRIQMETNCLLVRTPEATLLIDTGLPAMSDKERDIFAVEEGAGLLRTMAERGVAPEEVDIVLLTHLHMDHVGGAVVAAADGSLRPAFPQARCLCQRSEYDDALSEVAMMRMAYYPRHFVPLREAGVLEFIEGDGEIVKGVRVMVTGGHTRCHQIVFLESGGETAVFLADLAPTTAHLKPAWNMAFDLYPLETLQRKAPLLERACAENWLCLFEHDAEIAAARLARGGRNELRAVEVEAL